MVKKEQKEWGRFYTGVAFGILFGVIANLWSFFLQEMLRGYEVNVPPLSWFQLFAIFSAVLIFYGIGIYEYGKGMLEGKFKKESEEQN